MKTRLVALMMLMGGMSAMFAQTTNRAELRETRMQEMQDKKIDFIKEKVSLTDKEAAEFFPIYTEFEQKRMELNRECRPQGKGFRTNSADLSNEEKEAMMDKFIQNKVESANLEKAYYEKYKKVLSSSQLYDVFQADREFKHELLQNYRGKCLDNKGEKTRPCTTSKK